MRSVYQPLVRVRLRHSFYASGQSRDDFSVEPAAATRRALEAQGLIFRRLDDGWAVYGEVVPDSTPPRLLRPLGAGGLQLRFLLLPVNPHLWTVTELPEYRPGAEVFYFDNLRDDPEDGRLLLGDGAAGARLGDPLPLITGGVYTHRFAVPVRSAQVDLADRFGSPAASASFVLDDPDPAAATSEYRFDLAEAGLAPGRYTASDDQGGSAELYYDPEVFAGRPFGVVEIFSRTDVLTPDESELVPPAYRFLDGEELTGVTDYCLQLDSRSTTWRYQVFKQYSADGFALDQLEITGDVAFTRTVDAERAVFTSIAAVPLAESRQDLALAALDTPSASPPDPEDEEDKIRDLPSPTAATPLAAEGSPPELISELYVYV